MFSQSHIISESIYYCSTFLFISSTSEKFHDTMLLQTSVSHDFSSGLCMHVKYNAKFVINCKFGLVFWWFIDNLVVILSNTDKEF